MGLLGRVVTTQKAFPEKLLLDRLGTDTVRTFVGSGRVDVM